MSTLPKKSLVLQDEKAVYALNKKRIPGHWTRIESWTTRGIPDSHVCRNGVCAWFENKVGYLRKDGIFLFKLKRSQYAWLTRAWQDNCPAWVCVAVNDDLFYLSARFFRRCERTTSGNTITIEGAVFDGALETTAEWSRIRGLLGIDTGVDSPEER